MAKSTLLKSATIYGKALTPKQKKLFNAICQGKKMGCGGIIYGDGGVVYGEGDDDTPVALTTQHRSDWNTYVKYLETKNLRGNKSLDKKEYGDKVLKQYIKEHPDTSLTPELVKPIQSDFANYRTYALQMIKDKKAAFAPGTTEKNFMMGLSKPDAWAGSETTNHIFPDEYLRYIDAKGELEKVENKGLINTSNVIKMAMGGKVNNMKSNAIQRMLGGGAVAAGDQSVAPRMGGGIGGIFANLNDEGKSDLLGVGTGLVTDTLGLITNKAQYKGSSTGKLIGSTVGAAAGMALGGPAGAKIGSMVLGSAGALIGGASDKRKMEADEEDRTRKAYSNYNLGTNIDMYGNTYEEGGMTGEPMSEEVQQDMPQRKMVNVEKGEIMIDPTSFNIVRKFTNPNRYSPHKDKMFNEPMGNFVQVDEGLIIIPKRLAPRYEKGDQLTKKSIVLQILSDQAKNPMHNVPEEQIPAGFDEEQYAKGGYTGDPGDPLILRLAQNPLPTNRAAGFYDPLVNPLVPAPLEPIYPTPTGRLPVTVSEPTNGAFRSYNPVDPVMQSAAGDQSVMPENIGIRGGQAGKTNWNAVGRKALSDLPIFMQMAQSLQGDPFLQHNPNVGFDAAIGDANQLPENISIAHNLAANNRSFATAVRGIDNSSSPSTRAEKSQLLATKIAGDNAAYGAQANTNTQLRSSKLTQLLNLKVNQGASNAADNVNYMNEARMDQAARENNFNASLTNFTTNNAQNQNDKERVKALNSILHTVQVDPYAQQLIATHPGLNEFAINFMMDGKGTFDDAYREWLQPKAKKDEINRYNIKKTDVKGRVSTSEGSRTKEYK